MYDFNQKSNKEFYKIKCVILGDANIGKTSLVMRYLYGKFNQFSESTIGCSYSNCNIPYNSNIYRLDIWDTAGQERYRGLMPMYYRNADIVFLCIDLSEEDNNKLVSEYNYWKSQIDKHNDNEDRLIFLVGTKSDIKIERTEEELREILDEKEYIYIETSAKEGVNVKDVFQNAVKEISKIKREKTEKKSDKTELIIATKPKTSWFSNYKCTIL